MLIGAMKTPIAKKPVFLLQKKKKLNGYTYIEMLVVVTVTATVATIGIAIQKDEIAYAKEKAEYVVKMSEQNNQKAKEVYELLRD